MTYLPFGINGENKWGCFFHYKYNSKQVRADTDWLIVGLYPTWGLKPWDWESHALPTEPDRYPQGLILVYKILISDLRTTFPPYLT